MKIIYRTNGILTSTSLTEWYFGKKFVSQNTKLAQKEFSKTGNATTKVWQNGTGYLTIEIH